MQALVKTKKERGLWLKEVKKPEIGDHDVLIKIKKTSICGTDLHIYNWDAWAAKTIPVPLTIGHEFMGVVEQIGTRVSHIKVGERVSGEGHLICGKCASCRTGKRHLCFHTKGIGVHVPGCFAEYLRLPAENVFSLPETVSDELAAIFDPYGNAVHTALSFNLVGEDVLITGAGPIGIMATAIAKQAGARTVIITDKCTQRLKLAKEMGATATVNITKDSLDAVFTELNIVDGFTVGMEMSGNPNALHTLLDKACHGAKIALLGIFSEDVAIDWDLVVFKMLKIKGIYGREIFSTWYQMVHLLEGGLNLKPVITHRFHFSEFEKGIEAMLSGSSGKVILDWENG